MESLDPDTRCLIGKHLAKDFKAVCNKTKKKELIQQLLAFKVDSSCIGEIKSEMHKECKRARQKCDTKSMKACTASKTSRGDQLCFWNKVSKNKPCIIHPSLTH